MVGVGARFAHVRLEEDLVDARGNDERSAHVVVRVVRRVGEGGARHQHNALVRERIVTRHHGHVALEVVHEDLVEAARAQRAVQRVQLLLGQKDAIGE